MEQQQPATGSEVFSAIDPLIDETEAFGPAYMEGMQTVDRECKGSSRSTASSPAPWRSTW